MLEIIILFACGKKIAAICKNKNRTAWPWVLMMIFFWYGGAIAGAIAGVIVAEITDQNAGGDPNPLFLLGGLIGGAVLGLILTFVTVNLLPPNEDFDDDEDYEPRRRRRYDDEDDYEPRRRRDDRENERLQDPDDEPRGRRYADDDRRRDYDR